MVDNNKIDLQQQNIEVSEDWRSLDLSGIEGTIMVVGAPDTGKTTFTKYLLKRLCDEMGEVAYLDGDPGQSVIGPPATMNLAFVKPANCKSTSEDRIWRCFIGSNSPRGHMLPILTSAWKLTQVAYQSGAKAVVYDTSGLVDPSQGGQALKIAKIDLLRPNLIITIQKKDELEVLLKPLRRSQRFKLVELRPAVSVQPRQVRARQQYRAEKFAEYFKVSKLQSIYWSKFSVLPHAQFTDHRLMAFEDQEGFTRALGIVDGEDPEKMVVSVMTPLHNFDGIDTLRLGNLRVNPQSFYDDRILG